MGCGAAGAPGRGDSIGAGERCPRLAAAFAVSWTLALRPPAAVTRAPGSAAQRRWRVAEPPAAAERAPRSATLLLDTILLSHIYPSDGIESACSAGDLGSIRGSGRSLKESSAQGSRWLPTPVILPGEVHGHRNLAGCSSWGHGHN